MKQIKKKNTNSPDILEKSIIYGIKGFNILRFTLLEPGSDIINEFDINKLKVSYSFDFAFNIELNGFQIIFGISYHYELNSKDFMLLDILIKTDFQISDLKFVVKIEDNSISLPNELLVNFVSLAYSSARGIIFAKTLGSYLNQFILPLIDPKLIVQQKLNSIQTNSSQNE